MKIAIKNTSRALQGVHTVNGLQFIDPGATRELEVAEDYIGRLKNLSFFEIGKNIDRPPTESELAAWSRDRLVEATIDGVREEISRVSDEDLRRGLVALYSRGGGRDGNGNKARPAPSEREDLKNQANELGLEYPGNISNVKLKELIDAKLAETPAGQ